MANDKHKSTGLLAAAFTPMHEDCSLNLSIVGDYAALLRRDGVAGVFVCGSSGEAASLTVDERKRVAEAWRAAAGDLRLVVHVGGNCLDECRQLAAHAQHIGADAIAAVPPSYFRPASLADLVDWCRLLADAAGATPFYYYHIPRMTGVGFALRDFLPAAAAAVPTLAGAKFSHEDLSDFAAAVALCDGAFDCLYGLDEMLLAAMSVGARGAVGTTYNFAAPLYNRLIGAFSRGDIATARMEQLRAIEMIDRMKTFGFYAAAKAAMKLAGVDCGPVRPPLRPLTSAQQEELFSGLRDSSIG